ncbi:DUF6463 family protein [Acidovorax lacteus]|uniref:Uncharacterized protein n=1 Tax=Acidovorax lacteus TaxID=1924988 RepID=A0ABP8KWX4_9BURK
MNPVVHRAPPALRFRWKGPWLIAVAALHSVYAAIVFMPQWRDMAAQGVIASVGADPMLGAVAWFALFGALLALLGWVVLWAERHAPEASLQRPLGWGLLALTGMGIALMPDSGLWLLLPPALALSRSADARTAPTRERA